MSARSHIVLPCTPVWGYGLGTEGHVGVRDWRDLRVGTFSSWVRTRKAAATTVAISLLAGVPLTFAVLHQGFPVTDVDLEAREVWVTNGKELLAGRLNRQIEELNAAVSTASNAFDVLQDGDDVFLYDESVGTVERVDPAFTTLGQRIEVPPGSEVAHGGDVLAILSPDGDLWVTNAAGELRLNPADTEPNAKLGEGAKVAVSHDGVVYASSPDEHAIVRFATPGAQPEVRDLPEFGEHQLSVVGDEPIVLDTEANTVIIRGEARKLPEPALKLQQVGADDESVLLATGDGLLDVPLDGGESEFIAADIDSPVASADEVSRPVRLDGCMHGAWAGAARYLHACTGEEPSSQSIEQPTKGSQLEFRVNRNVIALNNLSNGNVWLVDSNLRLVDNWDEVTPPDESDAEEGDEKASQQTFEDTLAERSETNRPPTARDDTFGVRPGRTTILEVLENDTDPDGDVLTIAAVSEISEQAGRIELIDGGRALQFTPASDAAGTVSFQYTADDGRLGVAQAHVDVTVRPAEENSAPVAVREGAISVEQGKSLGYNVLSDWIDPDGDDLFLVNASPVSGDSVRFAPDGFVTFEHRTGELGVKEVQFVVSDGTLTATGVLTVDVKAAGSLNPVGTPDFAEVFAGETVLIEPLVNDLSPTGEPLVLLGVEDAPAAASVTPNLERGAIAFSSSEVGTHIFLYNLGAGAAASVGLIRVDVKEVPGESPPPIAVRDTAYLRPGEPATVPVLANDVSPSGRVLAVQSVDTSAAGDLLSVEVLTNTVARITASEALTQQLQFEYTLSDGLATSTTTVTVVPVPPLVKHQPPVAVDDAVTVRAGDIATVRVLENDYHPDASPLTLDRELAETAEAGGLVFVNDDTVRYQAPAEPGVYRVVYRVSDDFEQSTTASVRFTVTAPDADSNRAPLPMPLTSRTFEGTAVKIDVPLDGIDPDGDSVSLVGITTPPSLGRIVDIGSTHLSYEAYPGAAGTDTFTYEVADTSGSSAVGTIRIGVIPRPVAALPPNAVDDVVELRPGRTAAIDVLANDSDPSGYPIKVQTKLPEVGEGLKAEVKNNRVVVTAPEAEGGSSVRYEITNGHGGADGAFIQVLVANDAKIEPPTANDQVVEPKQIVDEQTVTVDPLKDAQNPGGLVEDLARDRRGPERRARRGELRRQRQGHPHRRAAGDRLPADERGRRALGDGVHHRAPEGRRRCRRGRGADLPAPVPRRARAADRADERRDLVECRRHRHRAVGQSRAILTANATNSDGAPPMRDVEAAHLHPRSGLPRPGRRHLRGHRRRECRRPRGTEGVLTIPVTVGDPNFEDVPPTFTPRAIQVEAGEQPHEVDLRQSSGHPNDKVLQELSYNGLSGQTVGHHRRHRREHPVGERAARRAARHEDDPRLLGRLQGVLGPGLDRGRGRVLVAAEDAGARRRPDRHEARADRSRSPCSTTTSTRSPSTPFRVIGAEIDQASVGSARRA